MGYGLDVIHGAGSVCSNLVWKSVLWYWTARGLAIFVYLMQGLGHLQIWLPAVLCMWLQLDSLM